MGYTATTDELEHIAALVHQERPLWDSAVVRLVLIAHHTQVDGTDLAIAALRCAKNPDMPSPKAIGWRGPHWQGLGTQPPNVRSPRRCIVCNRTEQDCYIRPGKDDDHTFTPKPEQVPA